MEKRIVLSRRDAARLRALISHQRILTDEDRETLLDLREEIDRAWIVDAENLPEDVVSLDSRVLVRDLETGESRAYMVVSPSQANLNEGRLSVVAPLGTALLGYRTGDEIEWNMPGGWRRMRIEAVMQADQLNENADALGNILALTRPRERREGAPPLLNI